VTDNEKGFDTDLGKFAEGIRLAAEKAERERLAKLKREAELKEMRERVTTSTQVSRIGQMKMKID
jgi:hypothetical protein